MARPRTIGLVLALVTVLVYAPVRHASFLVFDDPDYYTDNAHVRAGLTWDGTKWAFTTWQASNWHPLTWLSHMLDSSLFGPDSGAPHLINVLFHAANAVLLFLLLLRLTNKIWPAAFVAALFAWHPLHVESVAWISERKDVLSTFFGLLTLIAYVKYAEEFKVQGSKFKVWWIFALVFFALGLMAKPMLVTLPFVMLVLDFWPLGRMTEEEAIRLRGASTRQEVQSPKSIRLRGASTRQEVQSPQPTAESTSVRRFAVLLLEKAPFFALTIGSSVVTYLAQRGEAVMSLERRPFGLRVANAAVAYVEYLGKTFWPWRLAVIYPLPNQIPVWQVAGAVAILAGLTILAWNARRSTPYLLVGWLWFLGMLVPVIGLVQVGGQALADRYTYLPLVGVFIAIAFGTADIAARYRIQREVLYAVAGLILVGCIAVTERQLGFWRDSEALFRHALVVTKNNAVAHINLGVTLEQQGRRPEALEQYHQAVEIDPGRLEAHNGLADILSTMGERDEALREYQEAVRLNPKAVSARLNLGTLLSEMGRFDDAMREYTAVKQLAPEDPRPDYLMGKACLRQGAGAEAVKHFKNALSLAPDDWPALTWLIRVLASDKDAAARNGAEAVTLAEQANDLARGQDAFVLDTLGMAYAEAGRFKEARETVQRAIDLATANANEQLPAMRERLQLYESGRPYREDFSQTLRVSK